MRHQFTPAERSEGGRLSGTKTFAERSGIHGISPEQRRENSARGGRTQGPITGRRNVEAGQLDRIGNLPEAVEARRAAAQITGKAMGLKYGPTFDMNKVRT